MTCCVISKILDHNGKPIVVVGSESEVSDQNERLVGVVGDQKIHKLGNCYVLISGMSPIAEVLEIIASDEDFCKDLVVKNKTDVRELAETIYSTLKELVEASITSSDILQHLGLLLIATSERIFGVYNDLSVFEFDNFQTSGIGSTIAKGALHVLHNRLKKASTIVAEDLEAIVRESIEIANTHTLGCGGVIRTVIIKEEEIKRKKRK